MNTSTKLNKTIKDLKTSYETLTSELGKKHEDEKKQKEALEVLTSNLRTEIETLEELKEKQQKEIENLLTEIMANSKLQATNYETIKDLKELNENYEKKIECKEKLIFEASTKISVLEGKITN